MQVRGVEALKEFSKNLLEPYKPSVDGAVGVLSLKTVEDCEAEVERLKSALSETEALLERLRKGKDKS